MMKHYCISQMRYDNQTHIKCSCGAEFSDYLVDNAEQKFAEHVDAEAEA